ncbi:hypothetical protein QJS04_geneDACA017687 [Acorus gramineus]|uniref:Reverse transcriptase zinc-binding domain-containing protein n=1 Tax=Acorus gramineus TaxID=55184 RepID=A0AAV9BUV5_ACOGR|nr:hypothetical protein QJS04_geneDACA017687 [Acorus gramineus]
MSKLWKDISVLQVNFEKGIRWDVGTGDMVRFWQDVWVGDVALLLRFPSIFEIAREKEGFVNQFCVGRGDGGYWDIQVERRLQGDEVDGYLSLLELLHGVSVVNGARDTVIWQDKPREGFSVHSCYSWHRRNRVGSSITAHKYKEIWGCNIPLKVKAFTWTVYLRRILTKSYRARWANDGDILCSLCHAEGGDGGASNGFVPDSEDCMGLAWLCYWVGLLFLFVG